MLRIAREDEESHGSDDDGKAACTIVLTYQPRSTTFYNVLQHLEGKFTFNDEQYLPAFDVLRLDAEDREGEQTGEGTTEGGRGVVDGHSLAHFSSSVKGRY